MKEETFTIEFYSEAARKEFFEKYGKSVTCNGDRSEFFLKAMGVGDKFYERDALLSMLRILWDLTKAYDIIAHKKNEEKALSIIEQVVEKGGADKEFLNNYGGLKELERLESIIY